MEVENVGDSFECGSVECVAVERVGQTAGGQAGDAEVYSAGSYHDTLVKTDEGWRYAERKVIYDTSRVLTLLATPI